jgi:hypothetical protein
MKRVVVAWVFLASCQGGSRAHEAPAAPAELAVLPRSVERIVAEPTAMVAVPMPGPILLVPSAREPEPLMRAAQSERQYQEAMQRGRQQTLAKAYDAAARSFGEALALRRGDARALAERGYAHYLAGRKTVAAADLAVAAETADDPQLLGQIWFNRGLFEDNVGNARTAFRFSNRYAPSAAARQKLLSLGRCGAGIRGASGASQRSCD